MASRLVSIPLEDHAEHRSQAMGGDGLLALGYDRTLGAMRLTGRGLFSIEQVEAYFTHYRRLAERMRRERGAVRVLADLREAAVQSVEVAGYVRDRGEGLRREEDRFAVVLASSLVKLQMRRVVGSPQHAFFLSPAAAETWLRAFG
jgi:hypothetical protein